MPCISGISVLIISNIFFLISQVGAKFECNVSYTHSHYLIFLILSQYFAELCLLFKISLKLWRVCCSVYYEYIYIYIYIYIYFQFDILKIDASGWLNVMKQIKQTQPVLNMENSGHWAYLKLLRVKHPNGFEGYLILTGARSQLTTLIKPQYIALHMSGNPRFQYYSKPEWYFLRC